MPVVTGALPRPGRTAVSCPFFRFCRFSSGLCAPPSAVPTGFPRSDDAAACSVSCAAFARSAATAAWIRFRKSSDIAGWSGGCGWADRSAPARAAPRTRRGTGLCAPPPAVPTGLSRSDDPAACSVSCAAFARSAATAAWIRSRKSSDIPGRSGGCGRADRSGPARAAPRTRCGNCWLSSSPRTRCGNCWLWSSSLMRSTP